MSFIDPLPAEEEGGGAADLTAYEGETISLTATGEGQGIEVQATGDASAVNINAGPVVGGDGSITINAYGADGAVNISAPDGGVVIISNDPVTVNGDAIATEAYVDDALSGTTVAASGAVGTGSADYTTTSTTFVDVSATDFSIAIAAVAGDRLELSFDAVANHSVSGGTINLTFSVAGTDQGPTNGLWIDVFHSNGSLYPINVRWWHVVQAGDISGGTVTIKPRWRGATGTKTMKNIAAQDYRPVFIVRNWKQ